MTDLKVVDFKQAKEEQEQLPEKVMEAITAVFEMAKEGRLKELVVYGEWERTEDQEPDEPAGTMMIWNKNSNLKNIIGSIKMLESIAIDTLIQSTFMDDEG